MSGVQLLDFTSSLYLGFRHPHRLLTPWESLTVGKPAALSEPALYATVAQGLANLQGFEKCILAPSTLHIFWDLFGILSREPVAVYLDAGTYPIACWGVERAAAKGIAVRVFPHHDSNALCKLLHRDRKLGRRPIIISDGFCPACASPAPISRYLACARDFGGLLVIDDTQSLGILGRDPGDNAPYGRGGGGVSRWSGINAPEIMVVSSLAKGFGVPLAAICGSNSKIFGFEAASETRTHCSPPSAAAVHAAQQALVENRRSGDARRYKLVGLVRNFRTLLAKGGLRTAGRDFPMQTLLSPAGCNTPELHQRLTKAGLTTVLHKQSKQPLITLIITSAHRLQDIQVAASSILRTLHEMEVFGKFDRHGGHTTRFVSSVTRRTA